jgi:acyl carrier protein
MTSFRAQLRDWVVRTSIRIARDELKDDTPLLEHRIITSLQVMDLILFIESLSGRPVDVEQLRPGLFRDVDTICRHFLEDRA